MIISIAQEFKLSNQVNVNISKTEKAFSSLIKAKLKTFLLNQNTFYFNSQVNSDEKILSLLPKIVKSAFYKLDLYLNKIFRTKSFIKKMNKTVKLFIATTRQLYESNKRYRLFIKHLSKL